MKQRLADYVVDFLADKNVIDVFSVVGGGAMHLNDAFGHNNRIHVTYNHHEQACAMAAESYARLENRPAAVCVTTGPGGTNALTGVLCAWLDSIPVFVISGQVRYDTTARYEYLKTGAILRAEGDQEYDIVKSVASMTKYAVMVEKPEDIRYHLEKAWFYMTSGRKGPVWLDIPVNFQGTYIETEDLTGFDERELGKVLPDSVSYDTIEEVLDRIEKAERPVLIPGYGIRLSGGYNEFRDTVKALKIPVVTYWNAIDLIEDDSIYYTGRSGNMGDRPGNFAVQNADLILAVGTRISIRQTGYNYEAWAKHAKVIMVDIDVNEMKKHTLHVDMPIHADAKDFLQKLSERARMRAFTHDSWVKKCNEWKKLYPVVTEKQLNQESPANVYAFFKKLSLMLPENSLTAVSNGACCVSGHQSYVIKKGSRFINNSAVASMGYGLPAAIGMCISAGKRKTVCLEGDGSIMMNLQELQTIITNRLPIKIFLINNNGYHSIRITQTNLFSEHTKVGIGPESGDLSFPDFKKVAEAFGYPYYEIKGKEDYVKSISDTIRGDAPAFCQVFTDTIQFFEPKSSAKRLPDGTLYSPPLEDMAPFLTKEELKEQMVSPLLKECLK